MGCLLLAGGVGYFCNYLPAPTAESLVPLKKATRVPEAEPRRATVIPRSATFRNEEYEHQRPSRPADFVSGESLAFYEDGSVNPAFYEAFSFSIDQQAYFEKQWPLSLRSLNFMEAAAIVHEERDESGVVIHIKPFPQSGESYRSRLLFHFDGKIPRTASTYLEDSGLERQRNLFSGFGQFSQHLRISKLKEGWRIERDLTGVTSEGKPMMIDSIEMDMATIPLRYKFLFQR